MIKGTYEELRQLAQLHVCPEHPELELVVAWHKDGFYALKCGGGEYPRLLQRKLTLSELYRQGENIPEPILSNIKKREARMNNTKHEERYEAIERLPAIYDASDGSLVKGALRLQAINFARSVGLKPELGHVCLYYGKPWVTIDGWYYLFRQRYPNGDVITRPLNFNERKDRSLDDSVHAWQADVYDRMGGNHLAVGYGYAREGEEPLAKGSAVEPRWPWRLAEKRAEEDAIRKVVPLELKEVG